MYGPGDASASARYAWPMSSDAGREYDTSGVEDGEESASCVSVKAVAEESSAVAWRSAAASADACAPARTERTSLSSGVPASPSSSSVTAQSAARSVPLTASSSVTTVVIRLLVSADAISGAGESNVTLAETPPRTLRPSSIAGRSSTLYSPLFSRGPIWATTDGGEGDSEMSAPEAERTV